MTKAQHCLASVLARSLQPRRPMSVSQWCDEHMRLSTKSGSKPGRWVTDRNPPLREPMDNMSARSPVHDQVCMFPIQFGKSQLATNAMAYWMDYAPGPMMYALPGEVSMNKWIAQKLNPMIEVCAAVKKALTSTASRDSANQRTFKDFAGGQLFVEHMGSPQRLKSSTVKYLQVDEIDEAPQQLSTGDDPVKMLDGRTSSFPTTYKRQYISTPGIAGLSRIAKLYDKSDQRRYHVPCPHCGHYQALQWSGLVWSPEKSHAWYACCECGVAIEEHFKTEMIANGRWVAANPDSPIRGYTINCLYYQFGLGPRWLDLVKEWLEAQGDPASLKTFVNDRLAETWEDPAMRAVKHNVIKDRAEPYVLRTAPLGVLAITVGVDTQDNRLAVHIVGWGRGMTAWTLDYVELQGDPAEEAVWIALTDLLNRAIEREDGALLRPMAVAIDAGGHRTEAVKNYVRQRRITRPMCIFGAVPNNAPVLSKGKLADVTWKGKTDKRGITINHVGTVAAKHYLYSRLSADAERKTITLAQAHTALRDLHHRLPRQQDLRVFKSAATAYRATLRSSMQDGDTPLCETTRARLAQADELLELVRNQTRIVVDPADPWRGLYHPSRLPTRNADGEILCHPDVPVWADGREASLRPLFLAQGFDLQVTFGDFTEEAVEAGDHRYWDEMLEWQPVGPGVDWRLVWLGDTEDGPAAWFVRPLAAEAIVAWEAAHG